MRLLQAMEMPTSLYQDEFKIEVRSCSETKGRRMCSSRSPSSSSEGNSNFSFCAAHVQPACAYADEIFQNGLIRPLHSQPSQAVTLYEHLPHVETINVHEILEPSHTSSSPTTPSHAHAHHHNYAHAHASLSHTHHDHHSHHTSPTHTHFHELSLANPHHHASHTHANHHHLHRSPSSSTHPHHHASHSHSQSIESARATSVAAKCKRAFSLFFFPLRRVSHVNEDEMSYPPNREPFTPAKLTDKTLLKAHSTTSTKKLQSNSFLPTKGARSQNNSFSQGNISTPRKLQLEEAPFNIPPRVNTCVHTLSSPPTPHAIHYNARRAHKESMKRKTSLPYRHGFLACIGY